MRILHGRYDRREIEAVEVPIKRHRSSCQIQRGKVLEKVTTLAHEELGEDEL